MLGNSERWNVQYFISPCPQVTLPTVTKPTQSILLRAGLLCNQCAPFLSVCYLWYVPVSSWELNPLRREIATIPDPLTAHNERRDVRYRGNSERNNSSFNSYTFIASRDHRFSHCPAQYSHFIDCDLSIVTLWHFPRRFSSWRTGFRNAFPMWWLSSFRLHVVVSKLNKQAK